MSFDLNIIGNIAHISINRAEKRNAITQEMWRQLLEILHEIKGNGAKLILLKSAHPGVFCAGADIKEMLDNTENTAWFAENQKLINKAQFELSQTQVPTICEIDGDCVGGGMGLALACDFRIATKNSRFGITPAKLGLVYPLHDTKLLLDLVGPSKAKRLLFTGELINAECALKIGLIDEMAESAQLFIDKILECSNYSQREIKTIIRAILNGQTNDSPDNLRVFLESFSGADFKEGATAFKEKRRPKFI